MSFNSVSLILLYSVSAGTAVLLLVGISGVLIGCHAVCYEVKCSYFRKCQRLCKFKNKI